MLRIYNLLAALALGLAGWGGYLLFSPESHSGCLTVEDTERDLQEFPVGTSVITLRVMNSSAHSGRVVGLIGSC